MAQVVKVLRKMMYCTINIYLKYRRGMYARISRFSNGCDRLDRDCCWWLDPGKSIHGGNDSRHSNDGAIGAITGNKTISKIGMGIGLAGGVGSIANSMRAAAPAIGGANSSLLAVDNIDVALSSGVPGSKAGWSLPANAGKSVGSSSMLGSIPDPTGIGLDTGYLDRASSTLTKYSTLANIAGGMGEAYMVNEQNQVRKDLLDKQINFEQRNLDWQHNNNSVPLTAPALTAQRKPNAYAPLLRGY